jgi:hypothetical protein
VLFNSKVLPQERGHLSSNPKSLAAQAAAKDAISVVDEGIMKRAEVKIKGAGGIDKSEMQHYELLVEVI